MLYLAVCKIHNQKAHFYFLQETYSDKKPKAEWGGKIFCSHGTKHSKGVMILLNLKFDIDVIKFKKDNHGRLIEGFGGKRALGFLLKSELCQKRSKFRMQFCLRVPNNVLYVFPLKFAFFLKYYVCEKTHFSKGILWGPFVE